MPEVTFRTDYIREMAAKKYGRSESYEHMLFLYRFVTLNCAGGHIVILKL